ncbi:MAG: hypothetical protein QW579_04020 [Desulfurococcaceae archaeon]
MKGVESIVGAYLSVVIIIGTIFAFYTWISSYTSSINDQVSNIISAVQRVSYPPVISIKYANKTHFVLMITAYMPIRIKDLVLRALDNELVYHSVLNELVYSTVEIAVERPNKPVLIYLVTEDGFVFYYVPRLDPGLQLAPDNIKNKAYVDDELLDYIAFGQVTNSNWVLIEALGYKLAWGDTRFDLMNSALLQGPIICNLIVHLPCNVNMSSLENSVLTYGFNSTSDMPRFTHRDGFLEFIYYPSDHMRYVQIYRVIRFDGESEIVFILNITLHAVRAYTGISHPVYFIPVVYVYDSAFNPVFPVTLYQLKLYRSMVLQGEAMRSWLIRIPLTSNIMLWNSTSYYVGTFEVKVNPQNYGLREGYILIGVEVAVVTGIEDFSLKVKIDASR